MEVGSQGFKSGAILCVLLIGIVLVIKPKTYNATWISYWVQEEVVK